MRLDTSARLIAAFVAISAPPALAQQPDSTALPRVVVTATRVDAEVGSRLSTVTVLDGDALRRAGVHDVTDALRLVPGATVTRSGGPGAQSSLFLRGGESDYVRVLVDGVPVNDPGGSIDLAHLTLDNVERIEVVRGPVSVLYGTDAVTGVVQIFTRGGRVGRTETAPTIEAGMRAGTHDARAADLALGAAGARWQLDAGGARSRTDGVLAFNNAYRNDVATGRLTVTSAGGGRATVAGRWYDDVYHYPTDGAGNVVDRNSFRSDRRTTVSLDAEQPLGARTKLLLSMGALEGSGRTEDLPDGPADTLGFFLYRNAGSLRRRVADGRLQINATRAAILSLGGEWSAEAQRSSDTSAFGGPRSRFAAERENRAIYGQLLGERGRFSYVVGGRYDDNETFGDFRTARVAAAAETWTGGTIRASLGTAFKAPTFLETFNTAFTNGNPALRPERSRSWEFWAQQVVNPRLTVTAAWFEQRFRDLIQYAFTPDPTTPNYFNAARASSRGLEVEALTRPLAGYVVTASTTLLRTRVDDAGLERSDGANFVHGERLLRRPAVSGSLSLSARRWARIGFDAAVTYVGERGDRDFNTFPAEPVVLDSYLRVDGAATLRLTASATGMGTSLLVRADNLLGAGYEDVFGFRAPGRLLTVGLRMRYAR